MKKCPKSTTMAPLLSDKVERTACEPQARIIRYMQDDDEFEMQLHLGQSMDGRNIITAGFLLACVGLVVQAIIVFTILEAVSTCMFPTCLAWMRCSSYVKSRAERPSQRGINQKGQMLGCIDVPG
ncbi:hypothetical protein BDN67DRAFT_529259 [Paxillus ammoniavirescens]|nr:hypothetical protein BDN67DRAFT_529259 [Paxillus ammoniavirescens]